MKKPLPNTEVPDSPLLRLMTALRAQGVNDPGVLAAIEKTPRDLFTPDLFVVGGGVSKNSDKWVPLLDINTPIKPAELLNNAGIVGAAMAAHEKFTE